MEVATAAIRVPAGELTAFCSEVFERCGFPRDDARLLAEHLVDTDARGVHSHGVMRMPVYTKKARLGLVNVTPNIQVRRSGPVVALIDGDHAMGQLACVKGMQVAIEDAKRSGISIAAVHNSNHIGCAAYYPMMALEHDMIGFILTSSTAKLIAPWGGLTPLFDNSPFAVAIPAGYEYPVVFDMATSVVSRGRIILAAERGEKIPPEWGMDRDGKPCTDAHEVAFNGLLSPVGGYKGVGLAIIIELLGGALTGSAVLSDDIQDIWTKFDRPQEVGQLMIALNIGHFIDVHDFKETVDRRIREIRDSKRMAGVDRIYLPGEKEYIAREEAARSGVPVGLEVVKDLVGVAEQFGVAQPDWLTQAQVRSVS